MKPFRCDSCDTLLAFENVTCLVCGHTLLAHWMPVTFALNSLNRGMGLSDLYPFVLAPVAVEKLRFIHEVTAGSKDQASCPMLLPRQRPSSRADMTAEFID